MLRVQESHGQQDQVGLNLELAVGNLAHLRTPAIFRLAPLHAHRVQLLHLAVAAGEGLGQDTVVPNSAFFMGCRGTQYQRPLGPRVADRAIHRRLRQQLILADQLRPLPVSGAQAIRAGIAAAQDNHPLALGGQPVSHFHQLTRVETVLLGKIFHGEVNAVQLPARHRKVAGLSGAAGQADGVEVIEKLVRRKVHSHVDPGLESDPLFLHDGEAPTQHFLVQLEVGNAQRQQSADVFGALVDRHPVTGAVDLLSGCQSSRAGPYHRHPLAGANSGRLGPDPSLLIAPVGNFLFNVLDGDRVGIYAQNTTGLAGSGTDAPGKLREIVGGQQGAQRVFPIAHVHEMVEFRNHVAQWTAGVAEGNGAVHAPPSLLTGLLIRPALVELPVVPDALGYRPTLRRLSAGFHKSGGFTHAIRLPVPGPPGPDSCALPAPGDSPEALFS